VAGTRVRVEVADPKRFDPSFVKKAGVVWFRKARAIGVRTDPKLSLEMIRKKNRTNTKINRT